MPVMTVRDRRVLNLIGDYELLSSNQLLRTAFHGIRRTTVLRRLRKLEEQKLIKRTPGLASGELVWTLTSFGAYSINRDSYLEKVNRNNLEHDTLLNDIRFKLEGAGVASSWVTEQSIRRSSTTKRQHGWSEINPDAVFAAQTPDGYKAIAMELELNAKNPARYGKIFSHYATVGKFWGLWYVVGDRTVGRKVEREWIRVNGQRQQPKFGWVLAESVLSADTEIRIKTTTGTLLIELAGAKDAHTSAQAVSN